MNFENYNKIYKEILDDETGELSSNYLLNKYEIKHEEELLNILNQIKKNEYISSDNQTICKLISELDEDINLLDINEIINIKDKVINTNDIDFQNEEAQEKPTELNTSAIIEDKIENKIANNKKDKRDDKKSINTQEIITNLKNNINDTMNKKFKIDMNKIDKKYFYTLPVVFILILVFAFSGSNENNKEVQNIANTQNSILGNTNETDINYLVKKEVKQEINKDIKAKNIVETIVPKDTNEVKDDIVALGIKNITQEIEDENLNSRIKNIIKESDPALTVQANNVANNIELHKQKAEENLNQKAEEILAQKVKKNLNQKAKQMAQNGESIKEELPNTITKTSFNSEKKLNKIAKKFPKDDSATNIQLSSLDSISKHIKELKIANNQLIYKDKIYSENDELFGFKIFKIRPLYVKFEDTDNQIRKRFLLK